MKCSFLALAVSLAVSFVTSSAYAEESSSMSSLVFSGSGKQCSCLCKDRDNDNISDKDGNTFWLIDNVATKDECADQNGKSCRKLKTGESGRFSDCEITYFSSTVLESEEIAIEFLQE